MCMLVIQHHWLCIHLSPGLILLVFFGLATWAFRFDMASSISKEGTAHIPFWLLWGRQWNNNMPSRPQPRSMHFGIFSTVSGLIYVLTFLCPYLFTRFSLTLLMFFDSRKGQNWRGDVHAWARCLLDTDFYFWLAFIQLRLCTSILFFILLCSTTHTCIKRYIHI